VEASKKQLSVQIHTISHGRADQQAADVVLDQFKRTIEREMELLEVRARISPRSLTCSD
jgi:hypothetical protein